MPIYVSGNQNDGTQDTTREKVLIKSYRKRLMSR